MENRVTQSGLKGNYIDISLGEVFLSVVLQEQSWVITDQTVPVMSKTELPVLATCIAYIHIHIIGLEALAIWS